MPTRRRGAGRQMGLIRKMRTLRTYHRVSGRVGSALRVSLASRTRRKRASVPIRRASSEGMAYMPKLPRIAFRGAEGKKRAYIEGTPFDVWEIVEAYKAIGREVTEEGDLSRNELAVALSYYTQHRHEIDRRIEANRQPEEAWRELYPNVFAAQ